MRNMRLLFAISMVLSILLHSATYCEAEKNHDCPPNSCGSITNISYPFRLRGDPENCGNPSYELACEKNRTILYLNSSRFFVQSISYNNYSIRLLDPATEKNSCDSFPINSVPLDNEYLDKTYGSEPYSLQSMDNTPIMYIHCEAPAKSPFYVDTCICNKNMSLQKYSYFVVGNNVSIADLEDSCSIDTIEWISNEFPVVYNASCSDIKDGLAYGFDLTWYRVYCSEKCSGHLEICYITDGTIGCFGCQISGLNIFNNSLPDCPLPIWFLIWFGGCSVLYTKLFNMISKKSKNHE
ncbi:rust resistance kinase Lr10-like [Olea europaea subsp. europaea]|uniref:Rust resistance kinase Lr10-like n=1 Tax=Olea europaea subsp. europaea TaxID=158383 RepID=A0A8S0SMC0_OLEEU|nr:rust resistance kinase Lr10-like [Olea europaea subsp. europaea]